MLKFIKIKNDWRCFKAGDEFAFRPGVNLLVGDQGTGKSSLIHLLQLGMKKSGDSLAKIGEIIADPCNILLFDFERDNPRIRTEIGSNPMFEVAARFSSHGETTKAILKTLEDKKEPCLFVLDEPDMALCIRSIQKMIGVFKQSPHQIVASVHNPYLIEAFPEVLSLEDKSWVTSVEFIAKQKILLPEPEPEQEQVKAPEKKYDGPVRNRPRKLARNS